MTREDRKKDVSDEFIYLAISDAYSLIDKIYNDFEKQLKEAQATIKAQDTAITLLSSELIAVRKEVEWRDK